MVSFFFLNQYLLFKKLSEEAYLSFNSIALRKAKTAYSFGLSGCNRATCKS